ncbi:MAG: pentapeptide repeat-containing protein [Fimbriimonadales bacterium]|nr:pentapeptide repeat-containing protein [Fimbriimonadales bacterium]
MSDSEKNLVEWKYFRWGLGFLAAAYFGAGQILLFADIHLIPSWQGAYEAVPAESRGFVIQAAVTWFAGVIGLGTFFLNRDQKQRHLEAQLAKDREVAKDQRDQDREHHKSQLDQQRRISEYEAIQKEFEALSDDFAHPDLLPRINAGIGLADIAKQRDPRLQTNQTEVNEVDYPWFKRAAMQLSAALHIYEEPEARSEIRKAIREMASFDKSELQPLLDFLIHQLADANRTAYKKFTRVVAEGLSRKDRRLFYAMARAVDVFKEARENRQFLLNMRKLDECKREMLRLSDIREPGPLSLEQRKSFLSALALVSNQLLDTRDAIADCVKAGEQKSKAAWKPYLDSLEPWRRARKRQLRLAQCFLPRANLREAQLQGANLREAQLQGADLYGAQLQGAILLWAHLQGADLRRAQLQGAYLLGAQLQGAYLFGAQLQGADLQKARLQGANLREAQLQGANLREAQLQGADLREAQLQGANLREAQLQGAKMMGVILEQEADAETIRADFTGSNWRDADFQLYRVDLASMEVKAIGKEDEDVKGWLAMNFSDEPPDGEPEEENPADE